jgi:mannose-6-phosphate isomerase-like protein (cupin superfamily)
MDAFELNQLAEEQKRQNRAYLEFLHQDSMSVGIYRIAAGGTDGQSPHSEDEVYYVISGRAQIQVGDEHRPVQAGSIVFVAAEVEHRFHDITEELVVLVFFSPAEYALAKK